MLESLSAVPWGLGPGAASTGNGPPPLQQQQQHGMPAARTHLGFSPGPEGALGKKALPRRFSAGGFSSRVQLTSQQGGGGLGALAAGADLEDEEEEEEEEEEEASLAAGLAVSGETLNPKPWLLG